jgi:5-methylcytosine-specific restriction endonuclease McrA
MDTISSYAQDGNPPEKRCSVCKGLFLATTEYFYRNGKNFQSQCKNCQRAYHAVYDKVYSEDYLKRPAVRERRRILNRERKKRPEVQAYNKAYNEVYNETYQKEYRSRPEVQDHRRSYHQVYDPIWRSRPEIRIQRQSYQRDREAHKKTIPGTLTPQQIQDKLKSQHYACYYCFAKLQKKEGRYIFHLEHTVPVSRIECEPRHDINFVVLACPTCNRKKHDKLPHEWPEGGRLL